MASAPIRIEPVVSYPRTARPGERHYLTVDVRHQHPPDQWPYGQEELALTCLVDTALFSLEPLGDQKVVLHRFGGSYGPAAFLLTAREKLQKGGMTLSFVNRFGMTVHTVVLKDIEITEAPPPVEAPRIEVPVVRQVPVEPSAQRGETPASTTTSDWVSFSNGFTREEVQQLRTDLEGFRAYLASHGILEESIPPVHVEANSGREINSWYDPHEGRIVLHVHMVPSRDALLWEYARHVLSSGGNRYLEPIEAGIELGLADYLVCSFKAEPTIGADVVRFVEPDRPYLRDLRNRLHVKDLPPNPPHQKVGEIWGGAFWELREKFGSEFIDPILVRAWREREGHFLPVFLSKAIRRDSSFFIVARSAFVSRGLINPELADQVERENKGLGDTEGVSQPPPAVSDRFLHRPEEEQLFSLLMEPGRLRLIYVQGYSGQGVTTVLKSVAQRLERARPPTEVLWVDAVSSSRSGGNIESLLRSIARFSLQKGISGAVGARRQVVIVDNIDDLPPVALARRESHSAANKAVMRARHALIQSLNHSGHHAVLGIRHDVPPAEELHVIRLQDLNRVQMKHLAVVNGVRLSDDGAQELLEWTGGSAALASLALQAARKHQGAFEDFMRFETEAWSRIFDPEVARAQKSLERMPGLRKAFVEIARSGETEVVKAGASMMRMLEIEGIVCRVGVARWAFRSPVYRRVVEPNAVARLPSRFRLQLAPRAWKLSSMVVPKGSSCSIQLTLSSPEPLHGPIRLRLTPDIEKTVEVKDGVARATFNVAVPFGPITSYAETLDGWHRLGTPIERVQPSHAPPERGSPAVKGAQKKGGASKTAQKKGGASKTARKTSGVSKTVTRKRQTVKR